MELASQSAAGRRLAALAALAPSGCSTAAPPLRVSARRWRGPAALRLAAVVLALAVAGCRMAHVEGAQEPPETADGVPAEGPPELAIAAASAAESAGVLRFTVSLSKAPGGAVTVAYHTVDGTATAGTDYTSASGTLTFGAGVTNANIDVTILSDTEDEESETFTVTLSRPRGATLSDAGGTGTITDGADTTTSDPTDAPDDGTTNPPETGAALQYRGHGDQVFIVNPSWASLDRTELTLNLGAASAEIFVIATNSTANESNPEVTMPGQSVVRGIHEPPPRPALNALPTLPTTPERIGESDNLARLPGTTTGSDAHLAWHARQQSPAQATLDGVPATARSVVTDGAITATFWVGNADWDTGCSGAGPCVTQEMVDAMAERFLRAGAGNDMYDWVTAIFGVPWGPHSNSNLIPATAAQHIHVLLYDIDEDGTPSSGECRSAGYFSTRHSYLRNNPTSTSAERLIFFMDSSLFATAEGATWEVSDHRPSQIISTLAHEFQHMIHFYQKSVLRGGGRESWLNEMASEAVQDLVADKLKTDGPRGVAHDDPTAGALGIERGLLSIYNLYNDIQVTTFESKIANYAIVYAFGAYLARTYGAELFGEIVRSNKAGMQAIEAALDALGHNVSFRQVLADWAVANLLSDNTAAPAPYRYNPGTWANSQAGGQTFRLGSINLYHYRWDPPDVVSDCIGPGLANQPTHDGPYLHSPSTFNSETLPPHSNRYATLGSHTGSVRLQVTAATGNRITVVVKE